MKQIDDLIDEIARKHLSIETLRTRNSDSLDFHDVGVMGVTAALRAAYEAGLHSATAPQPLILLQDISVAMHEGGMRKPKQWLERIDRTIREAMAARFSRSDASALRPIVTVTVRGGLIEDLDATIPLHAVVEDWDVPDDDTGKTPSRNIWEINASLPAAKAAKLRGLIAND
jgi:hypothetical protein